MTLLIPSKQGMHLLVQAQGQVKRSSGNQMINLPPGMKSRNPGTKKIALETPVRTYSSDATYSGHCDLH